MQPKKLKQLDFPFNAMGTLCELKVLAEHPGRAHRLSKKVIADVARLEQKYSRYRQDSFLSDINRVAERGGQIEVDAETAVLLDYAETCYQQSDGLFDITSGVLRRAWRFSEQQLPEQAQIDRLLQIVGWHKIIWRKPVLEFTVPGMELDFGGVVKEYAVDRAATICQEAGFKHGFVNLGGDIKLIGPMANGQPWVIGIQHPRRKGQAWLNLQMKYGAMACSGDYERCIVINGVRYAHVLNPKTGWPVKHLAAVTVIGDFCVIAGSATTIAMLKEEQGPQWLQELGLPHVWMDVNGREGGSI